MTKEYEAEEQLHFDLGDGMLTGVSSEQHISDGFYAELAERKDNFKIRLDGYTPTASIPTAVVDHWVREGFDFWNAPANEINKKLRSENLETFIISGDTTFDH